jgi:adenylate cyclase class IV
MALLEIETKARLADRDAVMQKLEALGCAFVAPKTQDDTVYVAKTGTLEEFLSNDVFLRIRIQDGQKVVLTARSRCANRPRCW